MLLMCVPLPRSCLPVIPDSSKSWGRKCAKRKLYGCYGFLVICFPKEDPTYGIIGSLRWPEKKFDINFTEGNK